jgi:hypothetical protein
VRKFLTGASGHHKAWHIEPFLTSVQQASEVLLLAHADPADKQFKVRAPEPTCLLSHLVLPARAALWLGEKPLALAKGQQAEVPPGAAVFLRLDDVAVGIRVVLALDTAGKPAPAALVNDGQPDVLRLTVTHSPTAPNAPATVAFWVRAAEGPDDAAFAQFRQRFAAADAQVKRDGDVLDLAVPGDLPSARGTLHLRANVRTRQRLLAEAQGDDPQAKSYLLAVNGRDIGREILRQAPVVRLSDQAAEAARKGSGKAGDKGGK